MLCFQVVPAKENIEIKLIVDNVSNEFACYTLQRRRKITCTGSKNS
jgi:hypothetical protein